MRVEAANGSQAVQAIATTVFIFSLYALTTTVGLSQTLGNYADQGMSLICGDITSILSNYKNEPVFFLILLATSEIWNFIFSSGCYQDIGTSNFWLPVFIASIFISLLIYATRHLGHSAIYFHMVFCLDSALNFLPFHVLRQFIALVIVLMLISLMIRDKISPLKFTAYLVVASMIHFAVWLLVFVAAAAIITPKLAAINIKESFSKATNSIRIGSQIVVAAALMYVTLIFYYDTLATKVLPRLGNAPLSGSQSGSGLFTLLSMVFVGFLVYAAVQNLKHDFARRFVFYVAIFYILISFFGFDDLMVHRTRTLVLAIAYFIFLYNRNNNSRSFKWEFFNLVFLAYEFSIFFWNETVVRSHDSKPSFSLIGL